MVIDGGKLVHAGADPVVPKFKILIGGGFGAGNYGMCGRAYEDRFLWMWPGARISVMGGEQAAGVLTQIGASDVAGEDGRARLDALRAETLARYYADGGPYFSTARLSDDGILDPLETSATLGLALA